MKTKGMEEGLIHWSIREGFLEEEPRKGRIQTDMWAWARGTGKRRNKGPEEA